MAEDPAKRSCGPNADAPADRAHHGGLEENHFNEEGVARAHGLEYPKIAQVFDGEYSPS